MNKFTNIKDNELLSLFKWFLRANNFGMAGINVKGNRQILTYYTGVEADNPSGDTKNVKTIAYYSSNSLILTERFIYNIDNCIIEIITE